ncbi:MAG: DUF4418 family protein [Acidobacteriota bacterium]|jgi:hypothetical protein|nr:DUF4418 family protein [Acidobacteriota bacterium]
MKRRLIAGIPVVLLGILVAIGPRTVFPVCGGWEDPSMHCHWTALAETGVGGVLALLGLGLLLCGRDEFAAALHWAVFLNALLALLFPVALTGVCPGTGMSCRLLTLPALVVLSSLLMASSAIQGGAAIIRIRRQASGRRKK